MLERLTDFVAHTAELRQKFGVLAGTRLGLALRRDYTLAPGTPFRAPLPTLPHPVWLRADTSDIRIFFQLMINEELRFDLARPPKLIVDAGANVGLASLWFASRYPEAHIVALEPERANYQALLRNIAPYPNIVARCQALWSRPGILRITNPDAAACAFQVGEDGEQNGADHDDVDAIDIPSLLREIGAERIDLLKLDVEGAELEILREGAEAWIDGVGTLAVELHDRFRPGCAEALDYAVRDRRFTRTEVGEYSVLTMN